MIGAFLLKLMFTKYTSIFLIIVNYILLYIASLFNNDELTQTANQLIIK